MTKAVLETIHAAGFYVLASKNTVSAVDQNTNEQFIIRFDDPNQIDDAVIRLAEQVDIDLMDG